MHVDTGAQRDGTSDLGVPVPSREDRANVACTGVVVAPESANETTQAISKNKKRKRTEAALSCRSSNVNRNDHVIDTPSISEPLAYDGIGPQL